MKTLTKSFIILKVIYLIIKILQSQTQKLIHN